MTDLILEFNNLYLTIPLDEQDQKKKSEEKLFKNISDSEFFERQTNKLIIKRAFFDNIKRVPDVHRYDLVHINRAWKLIYPNSTSQDCCCCCEHKDTVIDPNKNNILVILESPHKDEYCSCCFKPLAPANGETGTNFCNYFTSHVLNQVMKTPIYPLEPALQENEEYSICFVNPVPFQTSLHFIRGGYLKKDEEKALKEKVWKALFNKTPCKTDFIDRMAFYSKNKPVIILNSCTGNSTVSGTLKHTLKGAINTAVLSQKINCTDKFNTYHPSAWFDNNLIHPNLCTQW
jgi:hypothetical protein